MLRMNHGILAVALLSSLNTAAVQAQGFTPREAVERMRVPEGLQVRLVASEPVIRQPLSMTFDDRGRMWVIQYLQYPTPSGLKPIKVDEFLRTVYDRVPEPPPKGPKGADRITILEDPDAQGHYRKSKDFVTGLNLASGLALGNGGVYIVQPPYLLFYPDKNGDDIPDGDPEVLLKGFGMEDAHAFANSLQWGPDGWLYGAQGSTVTANIRGIEFQQGIWRYHPRTKEFELFAEGGGNTWGLDFDRHGNVFAGTNWGGKAMLHQVQGGYYIKGFGKHGPLHNPYAFGYFDHVPHEAFKGGHVTCGGIVYHGGALPKSFEGSYIAANVLSNAIYWHTLETQGSSFRARYSGDLLVANDTWFRPVDCLVGPDGAFYIADWYDKRANHVDPVDNWDRSNGRIYKVEANGDHPVTDLNLSKWSSDRLVDALGDRNDWYPREARRLLSERRDASVLPRLRKIILSHTDRLALEALWALYVTGGFDDALAKSLLDHANEDVRAWTVRLLGDSKKVSLELRDKLVLAARSDKSPTVRSQLACTCKRLPAHDALPIVAELLKRSEDLGDPHIPLLLWWALENKASSDRESILRMFDAPEMWRTPLVRDTIVERLGRRYMAEGDEVSLAACSRLLARAPGREEVNLLVRGMEKALEGRQLARVPPVLENQLNAMWDKDAADLSVIRFALRLGSVPAYDRALRIVSDSKASLAHRSGLIEVLGQAGKPECVPVLLAAFRTAADDGLRLAILSALRPYPDATIVETILALYPSLSPSVRGRAQTLLCGRPSGALAFLESVDAGRIPAKEVTLDQLQQILLHDKEPLNRLLEKHWGKIGKKASGEMQARIRSVAHILGQGKGDPKQGKILFQQHCAVCHTLFGEGAKIGPELTGADRKNTAFLVTNIVDPSAMIRPEYVAHQVETRDGRLLFGLIVESSPTAITLVDAKNEKTVIARAKIEKDGLRPSPKSLMPEKILDPLTDRQIRDLFSYLQADASGQANPAQAKPEKGPLRICLISGSVEYESDASLASFQEYLEKNFDVKCSRAFRKADDDLPGLENLESCDVAILFTRRLTIDGKQLERIKKYCQSGKPLIGIRTASHALQKWLELDKEVLGGNYQNHYGAGPVTKVALVEKSKKHPILADVQPFSSPGSLYRNSGLAADVELLLMGSNLEHTEPIAWTRHHKGGRIFYTSLGHPKDFANDNFKKLLTNAVFWVANRPALKKEPQEKNK